MSTTMDDACCLVHAFMVTSCKDVRTVGVFAAVAPRSPREISSDPNRAATAAITEGKEREERRFWKNVQVLRIVAAYSIVYIHLSGILYSIDGHPILLDILRFGTDLFVVVAGFLTAHVLLSSNKSGLEYLRDRAIRILPLYFGATILAFLVQNYAMRHHSNSISELLMSLSFIPYGPFPILYPSWTLWIILEFSLLVGISHIITRNFSVYIASGLAVLIAISGALSNSENPIIIFYTNPMLIDFGLGVLIFKLANNRRLLALPPRAAVERSILVTGVCATAIILRPFYWPEIPRFISLGIPASGLLVAALTFELAGARIKSSLVTFLAKCSYAIYLCHWFVNIVSERIVAESDGSLVSSLLLLFVTPLVVTAVAIVVYLYVEAPTTAYLMRRFAGSKASDKAGSKASDKTASVRLASSR